MDSTIDQVTTAKIAICSNETDTNAVGQIGSGVGKSTSLSRGAADVSAIKTDEKIKVEVCLPFSIHSTFQTYVKTPHATY